MRRAGFSKAFAIGNDRSPCIQEESPRRPITPWRAFVRKAVSRDRDELALGRRKEQLDQNAPEHCALIKARLDDAVDYATGNRWSYLTNWLTGADIGRTWSAIHEAEERLLLVQSDNVVRAQIVDLDADVKKQLHDTNPLYGPYLDELKAMSAENKPLDREGLRRIRATLNAISDDAHSNVRNFRNLILWAILVLSIGLVLTWLFARGDPNFLRSLEWSKQEGCSTTIPEVFLAGALGGLLAGMASLRNLEGSSAPYLLPMVMALLKVPAGALTGLLGILWMQHGLLGAFKPQSGGGILAYAAFSASRRRHSRCSPTVAPTSCSARQKERRPRRRQRPRAAERPAGARRTDCRLEVAPASDHFPREIFFFGLGLAWMPFPAAAARAFCFFVATSTLSLRGQEDQC